MTTPTPDIVQRLRNRGHRIDLEAATTIEALRAAVAARDEAIRVLGDLAQDAHSGLRYIRHTCDPVPYGVGWDRVEEKRAAVDANPIARAACEGAKGTD
jgi:hypothetical protein